MRILRIIEGAIKNVSDAHGLKFDGSFARSVAKRACGTLSSQIEDVLAATTPSGKAQRDNRGTHAPNWRRQTVSSPSPQSNKAKKGRASAEMRRAPLRRLEGQISSQLRAIKVAGDIAKAEAWIEILRMIAKLKEES